MGWALFFYKKMAKPKGKDNYEIKRIFLGIQVLAMSSNKNDGQEEIFC
jgi:hypothetical protein